MKHKIIPMAALMVMFASVPAASAAPPSVWSSEYESLSADFETDTGFAYVSADISNETFAEGSFGGSNTFVGYFEETATGFVECFASAEVGPIIDKKLSNGSLTATVEGECFAQEFGEEPPGDEEPAEAEGVVEALHEENGDHGEMELTPFTATVDLSWIGSGLVRRTSSHFTGPGDVCRDKSAWRDATAGGVLTLQAEGIVDLELSPASSSWASIGRSSSSCHAKGSPGPA